MLKNDKSFIYIEFQKCAKKRFWITQKHHLKRKFMSLDMQKLEKCDHKL
jgi:hypothetical protein